MQHLKDTNEIYQVEMVDRVYIEEEEKVSPRVLYWFSFVLFFSVLWPTIPLDPAWGSIKQLTSLIPLMGLSHLL